VKFIIDNIFFIALALLSGGALVLPGLRQRGNQISLLRATQLINQGKTAIVDVRTPDEFATGHLRDAKNIPLGELANRTGELDKNKTARVIVICRSGAHTSKAAAELTKAGFAEVYGLSGGVAAWQAQGLPLTK